ncbi:hypothetical protein JCM8208_002804 [Rhodotorula glutinis]
MPRPHPLSTLRLKVSKTTVILPVTPTTTLSDLRALVLTALASTASSASDDDPDLALSPLPTAADDVALWRLDAPERDADGNETDKWVELRDESSGAAKWGVSEGEEIGVSFKDADGSFPEPTLVRPIDDEELE